MINDLFLLIFSWGVWLIYNVVLLSALQQSEADIYKNLIYINI